MASNLALGHYVAHVFTFVDDDIRLLHQIQQYVATGQAMSGAVYKAYFSSNPPAIERRAVIAANSAWHASDLDHRHATVGNAEHPLRGDLTLTLLSIDTTWRFDDFNRRLFSPTLTWPAIRRLYQPGSSLEADLILQSQSPGSHIGASVSPPAHILHVEITRSQRSDAVVEKIASRLRQNLPSSSRQLLFISDPAQDHAPHKGAGKHVLMQEFDARHTAGMIAANVDSTTLRKLSDEYVTDAVVRVFSLAGSATHHNVTPSEPEALKIDNHTHAEKFAKPAGPDEELYFGLRPEQYVHI